MGDALEEAASTTRLVGAVFEGWHGHSLFESILLWAGRAAQALKGLAIERFTSTGSAGLD